MKLQFSGLSWSAPKRPLFWSCPLFLDYWISLYKMTFMYGHKDSTYYYTIECMMCIDDGQHCIILQWTHNPSLHLIPIKRMKHCLMVCRHFFCKFSRVHSHRVTNKCAHAKKRDILRSMPEWGAVTALTQCN